MDLNKLRALSNNFRDLRLISLQSWKHAREIEPRDPGGPFLVVQEGYDPQDPTMSFDEFVLGRSGGWMPVGLFLKLPREIRRDEFIFGRASEVVELLNSLGGKAVVVDRADDFERLEDHEDDMAQALSRAKATPSA